MISSDNPRRNEEQVIKKIKGVMKFINYRRSQDHFQLLSLHIHSQPLNSETNKIYTNSIYHAKYILACMLFVTQIPRMTREVNKNDTNNRNATLATSKTRINTMTASIQTNDFLFFLVLFLNDLHTQLHLSTRICVLVFPWFYSNSMHFRLISLPCFNQMKFRK